ncbi:MAG TPA: hypothetical protein VGM44_07225 [Polyangiaceae bacterium]
MTTLDASGRVESGAGGYANVTFSIQPSGAAAIERVEATSAEHERAAASAVGSVRWPTQWSADCRAPYMARYRVVFTPTLTPPLSPDMDSKAEPERDTFPVEPDPPPSPPQRVRISRPEPALIDRHYPRRARDAGVGGDVELSCLVVARGELRCSVRHEYPLGRGFGEAALRVGHALHAQPDRYGRYPIGANVTVPIAFRMANRSRSGP